MNTLDKFLDIVKYNKLDKVISESAEASGFTDDEAAYARELIRIYEKYGVTFEQWHAISKEISELNARYPQLRPPSQ